MRKKRICFHCGNEIIFERWIDTNTSEYEHIFYEMVWNCSIVEMFCCLCLTSFKGEKFSRSHPRAFFDYLKVKPRLPLII